MDNCANSEAMNFVEDDGSEIEEEKESGEEEVTEVFDDDGGNFSEEFLTVSGDEGEKVFLGRYTYPGCISKCKTLAISCNLVYLLLISSLALFHNSPAAALT